MSAPTVSQTENVAAQSIAGPPQSGDDLKVQGDGDVAKTDAEGAEKSEGGDKTIFDDATGFNVKVSFQQVSLPFFWELVPTVCPLLLNCFRRPFGLFFILIDTLYHPAGYAL
jgi:hypothetical protein